ncbi:hypothetical protein CYLTODRAFT_417060 [Cylindrobasidium torrendii FP15055 ss-10]|uniref:MOSC domain-containing protein n=1 Tax=Cylindrobasidium torrendii FP15055 ss-10 TaxID=1314674 RepID=A0A0D7BSZ6_9AGAR|nr:hypothetical protein CYLTODRAFT_417060 [Cylindrobasidium torrendii FP15055 ss-10]
MSSTLDAFVGSGKPFVAGLLGLLVAVILFFTRSFKETGNATPPLKATSISSETSSYVVPSTSRVATIDAAHLTLPGFGYDNVRISKLLIHPIKSCRGTSVRSARYTPEGLENDRLWCVVDPETRATITAREVPKMVLITPEVVVDEALPYGGVLRISFPEDSGCETFEVPLRPTTEQLDRWEPFENTLWGSEIDSRICEKCSPGPCSASEIMSLYFGKPVHLVVKSQTPRICSPTENFPELKASAVFQDGYPLLFITEESLEVIEAAIQSQIGKAGVEERWKKERLVVERFRPNVVLQGAGPFAEDLWEEINIGETSTERQDFILVSKCARCLLPNVNPDDGTRDKAVPYKPLLKIRVGVDAANKRKPCLGCNGIPLGCGELRVGDRVSVRRLVQDILPMNLK